MSLPPMEKGARSPAELSGEEKVYHDRDRVEPAEAAKEEPARDDGVPDPEAPKPAASPTDCLQVKIKTAPPEFESESQAPLRRNDRDCPPDEREREIEPSSASSSRPPLSPQSQYRHILPDPHHPPPWALREPQYAEHHYAEPHYYRPEHAQQWHDPHAHAHHYPGGGEHDPHPPVRLPSIAALLTEPYNPQPMPRMAGYPEQWGPPPPPPAPERYPPMVAALPLDDSQHVHGRVGARSPQPMPQRKRGRLPKETTDFLKAWLHSHSAHPYPSEIEKKQMCHATGLSMSQVSNWMINGRRRILGPSYLSTSRSNSNPHASPPVTLSSPPVMLSSPSQILLTAPPQVMLRSPPGGPSS